MSTKAISRELGLPQGVSVGLFVGSRRRRLHQLPLRSSLLDIALAHYDSEGPPSTAACRSLSFMERHE
jgi:hypothetical protein